MYRQDIGVGVSCRRKQGSQSYIVRLIGNACSAGPLRIPGQDPPDPCPEMTELSNPRLRLAISSQKRACHAPPTSELCSSLPSLPFPSLRCIVASLHRDDGAPCALLIGRSCPLASTAWSTPHHPLGYRNPSYGLGANATSGGTLKEAQNMSLLGATVLT